MHRSSRHLALLLALPLVTLPLVGCGGARAAAPPPTADAAAGPTHHSDAGAMPGAQEGADNGHLDIPDSGVGRLLATTSRDGHRLREVDGAGAPGVTLQTLADPAGGWTVRIKASNFRWSPEGVNSPADLGAGHAHLYTPAAKVARSYGEWVFLSKAAAKPGDRLTVVLYADDHTAWAVGGKVVEASVTLPVVSS